MLSPGARRHHVTSLTSPVFAVTIQQAPIPQKTVCTSLLKPLEKSKTGRSTLNAVFLYHYHSSSPRGLGNGQKNNRKTKKKKTMKKKLKKKMFSSSTGRPFRKSRGNFIGVPEFWRHLPPRHAIVHLRSRHQPNCRPSQPLTQGRLRYAVLQDAKSTPCRPRNIAARKETNSMYETAPSLRWTSDQSIAYTLRNNRLLAAGMSQRTNRGKDGAPGGRAGGRAGGQAVERQTPETEGQDQQPNSCRRTRGQHVGIHPQRKRPRACV